ncbi:PP2C family protein-serine/threonine phosphatase [Desertivibrio insolitus]|uniref:PP2C family protein-serine/threonine phosphatase n=1 Tax=Herbiconiux sp. SYSU D00978 TaxID=2812562 RepID=UPI001A9741B1|nr:SpoIIE family protein phosphatase [Herbiconiux sp. SYSU D00978]
MLDATSLRLAFSIAAFSLMLLFYFVTYKRTRSSYSLWWCASLLLFLLGSSLYLFDGTPSQVWANPLGNGITVTGAAAVLGGSRSLNEKRTPVWLFVAPGFLAWVIAIFDDPQVNEWSGGAVFLALMSLMLILSSVELRKLEVAYAWSKWPIFLSCSGLGIYYAARFVAFVLDGQDGAVFTAYFGTAVTTLVTLVLLIVAAFTVAAVSLDQQAQAIKLNAEKTGAQLDEAARVQGRLLPREAPRIPGYEIAGICIPSGRGSGDFFDWQATDRGFTITVGDVMGKGMGAAMIAATVRGALRSAVGRVTSSEVLASVGTVVEPDLAANDSFVTLFHAHLSPDKGLLDIIDAGHGLGVVVRADGTRSRISARNLPLGVLPDQEWASREQWLDTGDLLLVFSDGILELFDGRDDAFERAVYAARAKGHSAEDIIKAVRRLAGARDLVDDVTVVAIRRTAPVPASVLDEEITSPSTALR